MPTRVGPLVPLPKDASFVELRPERVTFETRDCLLPGTRVAFQLVLEGRPLDLEVRVAACLVVDRDRAGYLFHVQLTLEGTSVPDHQIIVLFIAKGRGAPGLLAPRRPLKPEAGSLKPGAGR